MYKCPIDYYTDNLIFNVDKSCWAAYKLTGYSYDFLDDDSKIAVLNKTARFISGIMSESQILIVPVEQNSREHFRGLKSRIKKKDALYHEAINHADKTEGYLKEMSSLNGDINDYRTYIIVKLEEYTESEVITGFKEGYQYFMKNPVNAVNVFMNLDTKDILKSKINKFEKMGQKWFFEQKQKIEMKKVVGEELQWLFRRVCFRGLNEKINLFYADTNKSAWYPRAENIAVDSQEDIVRPLKRDIVNLFSGVISSRNKVLKVEHHNRTSYQTFLSLTNIPDTIEFPGLEWIYMLQQYNSQAEVCIHVKAVEYRAALRKLELKKREIDSQIEHIMEADSDIPEDLEYGKEYADAMEAELKTFRDPILETSITVCLAADTPEGLEEKVSLVKGEYEDLNFVVERSFADQLKLFLQFIPSVGCAVQDYVMPLTPMTLASGVIGATHELGDKEGPYIGTTGIERKPVYLYMGRACLMNKSAAATFFGNLGFGKSFNANLLVFLTVLYGGYGLIFDPKGERSHWEKEFKILRGLITTVTLSSDSSNRGKLDPYNVYADDISLANELAINVVSELFKLPPSGDEYTALLEAARIIEEEREVCRPSMKRLVEILYSFPESDDLCIVAKKLARRLSLQKTGMAHLLIGDGTEAAISLDNRLNIIQIQNLKLPSPETKKEDYTSEENLSTVLMMVLSHFAKKFALVKRPVFKTILFDESWALGKTAEGVKLYDYLSRMGRSLFTGCIFNGHSVLDIPTEGIKNTISYKFCFNTQNDSEVERMCDYLGLERTEDNKNTIKNLENGQCVFQDIDGHVGILTFDAVFQEIIDVFSTTPITEEKEQPEEEVQSNHQELEMPADMGENVTEMNAVDLDLNVGKDEATEFGDMVPAESYAAENKEIGTDDILEYDIYKREVI